MSKLDIIALSGVVYKVKSTGPSTEPCKTPYESVIITPRRECSSMAILRHWTYRTHCHLCHTQYSFWPESSEAFEGEVPFPRTQHRKNIERGWTWYFSENPAPSGIIRVGIILRKNLGSCTLWKLCHPNEVLKRFFTEISKYYPPNCQQWWRDV